MAEQNTVKTESDPMLYLMALMDILKGWWLILIVALISAMVSYVYVTETYEPSYTTEVTFVVSAKNSNTTVFSNISTTSNLAGVFTNVINSAIMKNTVSDIVGPEAGSASISASAIEGTNLLKLNVTSGSPIIAFKVAKTIINEHQIVTGEILENAILEVLKWPEIPSYPTNSMQRSASVRKVVLISMGVVAGLLAILSYMSGTVKSEGDIGSKIEAKLLVTLYHEEKYKTFISKIRRRKSGILITNPFVSFRYAETIKTLRTKVEYQARKHSAKVIMLTSVLENEGKSTVAANLSIALAQKGSKVLLIDADLRKPSVYKIFNQSVEKENEFELKTTTYGLSLLLAKAPSRTVVERALSSSLKNLITQMRDKYDYIIVDTPPMSVASDAERISEYSDASVLVVRFNRSKINDISDAITVLRESNGGFLGCVYNDVYAFGVNVGKKNYAYGYKSAD